MLEFVRDSDCSAYDCEFIALAMKLDTHVVTLNKKLLLSFPKHTISLETNRKVTLQQLALLGYRAEVTSDGRKALERWESGDYALLLTDLHMPAMDGYQLTAAIRAGEAGKRRMPIVALTANALQGEAEHCRATGMDDYLSKPAAIATELQSACAAGQATAASAAAHMLKSSARSVGAMALGELCAEIGRAGPERSMY